MILGVIIGFWGYLNVGVINVSVMQLAFQKQAHKLIVFIAVAVLFEILYCFGMLYMGHKILENASLLLWVRYVTIGILIILGILCFIEARKPKEGVQKVALIKGYTAVLIHPQQIPFWLVWGTYLIDKQYITLQISNLFFFALSVGLGAFLIFLLFVYIGRVFAHYIIKKQVYINYFVGSIMLILAFRELFLIIYP